MIIVVTLCYSCAKDEPCFSYDYAGSLWVERSTTDTVFQLGDQYSLSTDTYLFDSRDRYVNLKGDEVIYYNFGLYRASDEKWEAVDSSEIQVESRQGKLSYRPDASYWGNYFTLIPEIESSKVKSKVEFKFLKPGRYALQMAYVNGKVLLQSKFCTNIFEYGAYFIPDSGQTWTRSKPIMIYVNP